MSGATGPSSKSSPLAAVIDLGGACLMPGLWDVHIHPDYYAVDDMPIGDQVVDLTMLLESGIFGDSEFAEMYQVVGHAGAANYITEIPGMAADIRTRIQHFLRHDTQGGQQLKRLRAKALVAMSDLLRVMKKVDLLTINDEEARDLSGISNILKAAADIRKRGPGRLIIKRGEYGALLFDDDGVFFAPAYPLEQVLDPTATFADQLVSVLMATHDQRIATDEDRPQTRE